ncbi:MAG: hypothetical protein DMG06_11935 [Acidobacteria bacterium]|nr:MAG: hypothetical protein DMG06_11935 [Acidobacteriota bacterium]
MTTHADVMARTLASHGVQYVFGLPGGEIVAFVDACRRAGLRFLLTGHESSAALMAQVIGQIRGVPGVCAATLGPGATNLVTGVANAFLDRSPLLAVTAQIPKALFNTMTHQRLGLDALFASITKETATVGEQDTDELTRDSLRLASSPRPGPVHLVLPSDVAIADCNTKPVVRQEPPDLANHGLHSTTEIKARIAASQRPLVLVGLGTPLSAAPAVWGLIDALKAPFMVTPKAKGIVPEDHPFFLGVATGMAIDQEMIATLRAADLVIGIGFDPVECDRTWFAELEIVAIDSVSMAEGAYHPMEAIGEISSIINQLATSVAEAKPWPEDLLQFRRRKVYRSPGPSGKNISPLGLIEGLRSVFPRNGMVSCDVGSHKLLMGQFWRSYEPGTFFMSNGLSGMGYGIAAAVAAQLEYPDRSVMAVVGDGGMLMMLHDLVLIRELRLPIIMVVLIDGSLSLIQIAQARRGFPSCGVNFHPPDFVSVANGFGLQGERARNISEAKVAVEKALNNRTALVLEVPVDVREYYDLV